MNWIEQIVAALLKWCQGFVQRDIVNEDSKADPALRERLRDRIRDHERRVCDPGDHGPRG